MSYSFKAILGRDGKLRLRDKLLLKRDRKVLVTILDDDPTDNFVSASNISESVLARDWNRPEEDEAWQHLQ